MVAVRRIVVLAWLLALPGLTAMRASVWQNDVTLWTDATWRSTKPRPWINLAGALLGAQRYHDAAVILGRADALIGPRPEGREKDTSWAYASLVRAHLALLSGQWTIAQQLAADLKMRHGQWPPAESLCRSLQCAAP